MIGIIVDTTIIKLLIKKIIPKLSYIFEGKNEDIGNFIGNNFITKGLTNLFSTSMIDRDLSLLIWDLLFLEGNTVLFKAFLAIYSFLSDKIIKGENTIEFYNDLINNELKKINKDNDQFLYNLFFKNDKVISKMDFIDYRYNLSLEVADSLEEQNIEHVKVKVRSIYDQKYYNKQFEKSLICNKKWPYCINDTYFENVTRIVFYNVFQETDNKYIKDYFFPTNKKQYINQIEENNKIKNEDIFKIRIERRPHYCNQIQNEINEKEKIKEKEIQKKEEENDEIDKLNESHINEYIQKIMNNQSFLNTSKFIEQKIDEHFFDNNE